MYGAAGRFMPVMRKQSDHVSPGCFVSVNSPIKRIVRTGSIVDLDLSYNCVRKGYNSANIQTHIKIGILDIGDLELCDHIRPTVIG